MYSRVTTKHHNNNMGSNDCISALTKSTKESDAMTPPDTIITGDKKTLVPPAHVGDFHHKNIEKQYCNPPPPSHLSPNQQRHQDHLDTAKTLSPPSFMHDSFPIANESLPTLSYPKFTSLVPPICSSHLNTNIPNNTLPLVNPPTLPPSTSSTSPHSTFNGVISSDRLASEALKNCSTSSALDLPSPPFSNTLKCTVNTYKTASDMQVGSSVKTLDSTIYPLTLPNLNGKVVVSEQDAFDRLSPKSQIRERMRLFLAGTDDTITSNKNVDNSEVLSDSNSLIDKNLEVRENNIEHGKKRELQNGLESGQTSNFLPIKRFKYSDEPNIEKFCNPEQRAPEPPAVPPSRQISLPSSNDKIGTLRLLSELGEVMKLNIESEGDVENAPTPLSLSESEPQTSLLAQDDDKLNDFCGNSEEVASNTTEVCAPSEGNKTDPLVSVEYDDGTDMCGNTTKNDEFNSVSIPTSLWTLELLDLHVEKNRLYKLYTDIRDITEYTFDSNEEIKELESAFSESENKFLTAYAKHKLVISKSYDVNTLKRLYNKEIENCADRTSNKSNQLMAVQASSLCSSSNISIHPKSIATSPITVIDANLDSLVRCIPPIIAVDVDVTDEVKVDETINASVDKPIMAVHDKPVFDSVNQTTSVNVTQLDVPKESRLQRRRRIRREEAAANSISVAQINRVPEEITIIDDDDEIVVVTSTCPPKLKAEAVFISTTLKYETTKKDVVSDDDLVILSPSPSLPREELVNSVIDTKELILPKTNIVSEYRNDLTKNKKDASLKDKPFAILDTIKYDNSIVDIEGLQTNMLCLADLVLSSDLKMPMLKPNEESMLENKWIFNDKGIRVAGSCDLEDNCSDEDCIEVSAKYCTDPKDPFRGPFEVDTKIVAKQDNHIALREQRQMIIEAQKEMSKATCVKFDKEEIRALFYTPYRHLYIGRQKKAIGAMPEKGDSVNGYLRSTYVVPAPYDPFDINEFYKSHEPPVQQPGPEPDYLSSIQKPTSQNETSTTKVKLETTDILDSDEHFVPNTETTISHEQTVAGTNKSADSFNNIKIEISSNLIKSECNEFEATEFESESEKFTVTLKRHEEPLCDTNNDSLNMEVDFAKEIEDTCEDITIEGLLENER